MKRYLKFLGIPILLVFLIIFYFMFQTFSAKQKMTNLEEKDLYLLINQTLKIENTENLKKVEVENPEIVFYNKDTQDLTTLKKGTTYVLCTYKNKYVKYNIQSISYVSPETTKYELKIGEEINLLNDTILEHKFESSDETIAIVDNGIVKAKSEGSCIITEKINNLLEIDYSISVLKANLNKEKLNLYIGEETQLEITNCTSKVSFEVENDNIVSITNDGKIKALNSGETNIIIKFEDNTLNCFVKVEDNPYIKEKNIELNVGDTYQIKIDNILGIPEYISENTNILTVTSSGLLTALDVGETKVKINIKNQSLFLHVKILEPIYNDEYSLTEGESIQLQFGNLNKNTKVRIDNPANATIDKDFILTGYLAGQCNIIIEMNNYSKKIPVIIFENNTSNNVIELAVQWQIEIANGNHGYNHDEDERWGQNGDYDCSALNITAWENAGVPVKTAGAGYSWKMINEYLSCGFVDVTNEVNLNNGDGLQRGDVLVRNQTSGGHVAQYIGNSQIVEACGDEKGEMTGGQPGDQTGSEITINPYTNASWSNVLRYEGPMEYTYISTADSVIDRAVDFARAIANDNSHGYNASADERFGQNGDYSCAGLVLMSWENAGVPLYSEGGAWGTGDFERVCLQYGFKDVTNEVDLRSGRGVQKGDIVLCHANPNQKNDHVEICVGDDKSLAGAKGNSDGKPGDSSADGHEISITGWYDFGWNYCFRYVANPYFPGPKTSNIKISTPTTKKTITEDGNVIFNFD